MIRLRAIKGHMGTMDYFLTTATLGEVARIVNYREDSKEWPAELRQQRPLNMTRVRQDMVPYLIENPDHFYNALVVEHVRPGDVVHDVRFVPDTPEASTGWVELEGSETLEALDGQHRLKSIELAVAQMADLAKETIAVVIVPHRQIAASQQLFSDLNRNAKPTPKSLNILFEHRQVQSLVAKKLAQQSKYLRDRVNMTGSNLSARSPYVVTIATLYEGVKILLDGSDEDVDVDKETAKQADYWDTALGALPGMDDVLNGSMAPGLLRAKYVYATGLGFEAIAEAIKATVSSFPSTWQDVLREGLPRIKWELVDNQWEGVAMFAGRVAIARAARRRTATLVKHLLGLEVNANELKELEDVCRQLNRKVPSPVLVPTAV